MATTTQHTTSPVGVRQRLFRRTNIYSAEYILMLVLFGGFITLLAFIWYTFFGLLIAKGYSGERFVETAMAQIAALLVVGPLGYLLYSRVTGEELHNPLVLRSKVRAVFLTIWMLGTILTLVGLLVTMISSVFSVIFGLDSDIPHALLGVAIPSLLAALTLSFGIWAIVKRSSRKIAVVVGAILAGLAVIALLATTITVLVKKNQFSERSCSNGSSYSGNGCRPDSQKYNYRDSYDKSYDTYDYNYSN